MTKTSSTRLGLWGARADNGGLGIQTRDFYNHMQPHKTMVVDISALTGYENDFSFFPNAVVEQGPEVNNAAIDSFLDDLDVVFTVEAPYNHALYSKARERGIKTVCQYNFEFLGELAYDLPKPDLYLAPSTWHIEEVRALGVPVKYKHVPVDRQHFPFTLRHRAERFLHIAGHRTDNDRNGTAILLEALPHIHSDIEIVIRTQAELPRPYTDSRLTIIREDVADNRDLYNREDVLILPRRYGGLSLQLNEALSLGMPAIMLDIEPNNWLMNDWLVPATLQEQMMAKSKIDVYQCTPQALAAKIDEFASRDITADSQYANKLAGARSWNRMKSQYELMLRNLCSQ